MLTKKVYHNPSTITVSFFVLTTVIFTLNLFIQSNLLLIMGSFYCIILVLIGVLQYQAKLNVRTFTLTESEKLLIISPHQDDCVLMAGGLAIKNLLLGGEVKIVYLTQALEASTSMLREAECVEAWSLADLSNDNLIQLNLLPNLYEKPNKNKLEKAREKVQEIVDEYEPTMVVFPLFEGGHRQHDIVNYILSFLIKFPKRTIIFEAPVYSIYYSLLHTPHKIIKLVTRFSSINLLSYFPPVESIDKRKLRELEMTNDEIILKNRMLEEFSSQNGKSLSHNYGYPDRLIPWVPGRYRSKAFNFEKNLSNLIRIMYEVLPTKIARKIYPTDICCHGYEEGITDMDYELEITKSLNQI